MEESSTVTSMRQSFFVHDWFIKRSFAHQRGLNKVGDCLVKANQTLADWQTVDSAFLRSVFYEVTHIPPIFIGLIEYFVKYERMECSELPVDGKECGVCTEPMNDLGLIGERPIKLHCGHIVGERCLAAWLWQFKGNSNRCPTCRTEYWCLMGEHLDSLNLRSSKLLKMIPDSPSDADPESPYDCVKQVWHRAVSFLKAIEMRTLQYRAYADRQSESRRRCLLENSLKVMVRCCQYPTNFSPTIIALDHSSHTDTFCIEPHMFINWVQGAIPAAWPLNKTALDDLSRISEDLTRLSNTPELWEMAADETDLYDADSRVGPLLGHLRTIHQQVQDIETVWAAHRNPRMVIPAVHLAAHNRLDEGRIARGYISARIMYSITAPNPIDSEEQQTQQERQQEGQQEGGEEEGEEAEEEEEPEEEEEQEGERRRTRRRICRGGRRGGGGVRRRRRRRRARDTRGLRGIRGARRGGGGGEG